MNEYLAMLLDGSNTEWTPIALGALATVVAGIVLFIFKRHFGKQDDLEKKEQTELQNGVAGLNLRLESETELRRSKDDELGEDIQDIRGVVDHHFGTLGKPRPIWRSDKR